MDANTYSLKTILNQERRYVVPTFQRDYEWTQAGQWELLFDDLEAVADRLHDERVAALHAGETATKADRRVPPHFLGAVVLDQLPTPAGGVDLRAVIDGQQRLTTIQLMLRAVLDVLQSRESPREGQVRRLLTNPADVVNGPEERHKLWPRRRDRDAWLTAMDDESDNSKHQYGEARRYFRGRVEGAVVGTDGEDRLDAVVDALLDLFKVVVIDLEDNDDAQLIFEVLNGRQTPLSAADLVKNLLFLRAELQDEEELESLYDEHWAPLDEDWWKQTVGRGHAARGRRDVLLSSWLTAVSGKETNVGHLYGEVRGFLDRTGRKTHDVLGEIGEYRHAYGRMYGRSQAATERIAVAYRRLDRLGIVTAVPLLLWLQTLPIGRLAASDHERAVVAVESWIVRRLLSGANTRGYGKAFVDVLKASKAAAHDGSTDVADRLVEALRDGPNSLEWPSDNHLTQELASRRFYGSLTQERIRLILGAIDECLQSENPRAEPASFDYDALQIEHVMPQKWGSHWALPNVDDAQHLLDTQLREAAIHQLGNLTLVTSSFNKELSNSGWSVKKTELVTHSNLQLNRYFGDITAWDERQIRQRAAALAAVAARVWPSPEALARPLG